MHCVVLFVCVFDQEDVYRCESVRLLKEALQMSQAESNAAQGEHHKATCGLYSCVLGVGRRKWQLCAEEPTCCDCSWCIISPCCC